MYESGLNTDWYWNVSGYKTAYDEFVNQAAYNYDMYRPNAGPIYVNENFPSVEHIRDTFMIFVHKVHKYIG